MKICVAAIVLCVFCLGTTQAQHTDAVDTVMLAKIRAEGFDRSQVMDVLSMITDVSGPRLTNSPGHKQAATYAKETFQRWGLANASFDSFGEFGKGWSVKKFSLQVTAPVYFPVIAYPKAWSPGIKKTREADAIYLDVKSETDLEKYKGRLKGKVVLFSFPIMPKPTFTADAIRLSDSTLMQMAGATATKRTTGSRRLSAGPPELLTYKKWKLCQDEGALAILDCSRGSYGTFYAQAATVPVAPDATIGQRVQPFAANAPEILPQISVAAEHYNRMVRELEKGLQVKVELTMKTEFTPAEDGFNVIAEIPGTDKKDQVVMIGAHLDSWHSGTGTTDNGVGVAVCMEAMRILKAIGAQPSRTIRIGLWGGEEQGLYGSKGYVKKHLGQRIADSVVLTDEGKKFSVYFNTDNGTGKWRGIYLQGNQHAVPVFKEWIKPFAKTGTSTLTLKNTGSTDHIPFDDLELPAFQFLTDPIEYYTKSWHSSMDMYERAVEADLKHNAVLLASWALTAANRAGRFPKR